MLWIVKEDKGFILLPCYIFLRTTVIMYHADIAI